MDIIQTAQDKSTVPSETAGYSVADYRTLQTATGKQPCVSQSQLLVSMQTAEKDDKGMWYTKSISFRCSRHGFATLALSKGIPIESVSRVLGHTNIVTTPLYAKITIQKIDDDLTKFGNKLNQPSSNNISMR